MAFHGPRSGELEIDLGRAATLGVARLGEDVARGQCVARYALYGFSGAADGGWTLMSRGTTIGYAKLDRFAPATARRVRLEIEDAVAPPGGARLSLFAP